MASSTQISKWMSLVLRHDPGSAGLTLDDGGWVAVDAFLAAAPMPLARERLAQIVADNAKKRFAFSDDGTRIRASQGHSVPVDLGLESTAPPDQLYHGTATRFLEAIMEQGLTPQGRHHVHLSLDIDTARTVGQRHGTPLILTVAARAMADAGHLFYRSANGVWLTETVPTRYLTPVSD